MTMAETDFELILDSENWEAEPCAFHPCANESAWYLLCGMCRAAEPVCEYHHTWVLEVWEPEHQVLFDQTCGHRPEIQNCLWERR